MNFFCVDCNSIREVDQHGVCQKCQSESTFRVGAKLQLKLQIGIRNKLAKLSEKDEKIKRIKKAS